MKKTILALFMVITSAMPSAASEDWQDPPVLYSYNNLNSEFAKEAYLAGLLTGYDKGINAAFWAIYTNAKKDIKDDAYEERETLYQKLHAPIEEKILKRYDVLKTAKQIFDWAYTQKNVKRVTEEEILFEIYCENDIINIKKNLLNIEQIRTQD